MLWILQFVIQSVVDFTKCNTKCNSVFRSFFCRPGSTEFLSWIFSPYSFTDPPPLAFGDKVAYVLHWRRPNVESNAPKEEPLVAEGPIFPDFCLRSGFPFAAKGF